MTPQATIESPTSGAMAPRTRRATLGLSGLAFVLITVFLAVGAVNSQNNLLFWVFGLSVAAVLVSGIISGSSLMGLRVAFGDIPDTPAGSRTSIPYSIVSTNRLLPVFALTLTEVAPAVPGGTAGGVPGVGEVLHVEPRGRVNASTPWHPQRRGPVEFDRLRIESRFPFGFIVKVLEFSCPRAALVTPPLLELDPSLISAIGDGQTEHRVKRARRGSVGGYFGLRTYSQGDPRRQIAWKPSARRSELLVIEHAEPEGRSIWVHLPRPVDDPARTPADALIAETAIALAASLVRAGSRSGRSVGVWAPWAGVRLAPATGRQAEHRAARVLGMMDLTIAPGADTTPPARAGDAIITVPLTPAAAGATDTLDPARPADWLAPGHALPPCLTLAEGAG